MYSGEWSLTHSMLYYKYYIKYCIMGAQSWILVSSVDEATWILFISCSLMSGPELVIYFLTSTYIAFYKCPTVDETINSPVSQSFAWRFAVLLYTSSEQRINIWCETGAIP